MYSFPENALDYLMGSEFATARNINLHTGKVQFASTQRATGCFEECVLENIEVQQIKFHELFSWKSQVDFSGQQKELGKSMLI